MKIISKEQKLETKELELKESIKKLRASERKLQAANQQLTAKEQQLRAANQQLTASEQQLRAANQELKIESKKLRFSEKEISTIFNTAAGGMCIVAPDFRIRKVNHTYLKMVGLSEEEVIGRNCYDVFTGEYCHSENCPLTKLFEGKEERLEFEILKKRPDGKEIQTIKTSTSLKDDDGNFIGIVEEYRDMTEYKKAEEALKVSEEKYRLLHENAGLGIGYYTPEGIVLSYNNVASDHLSGKPEDFTGKSIFDLFPKEEAEEYYKRLQKAIQSEEIFEYEDFVKLPKQDKWFLSTFTKVVNSQKNTLGVQIISQDITERKAAEVKLNESEERFRELVDTVNSGVAIYKVINDGRSGSDYIIQDFNQFALQHEKMKKEDVIGKSLKDVRPNIDEYGLIETFREVWKTGKPAFFPAKVYIDDKYSNYYENRVFKLPSGEIVAIYDDVTDREISRIKIAESEAKFRSYIDCAPDGVFITDETGKYVEVNQAACDITGYSKDELTNMHISDTLQKSEIEKGIQHFKEVLESGSARGEIGFATKSGENRFWEVAATKLSDTRFLGFVKDVTERRKALKELISAKEKAEESDRLKSAFLANMSHEIRTPMNGILGFAELLKEPGLEGEEQQRYISIIEKSGNRMLNIINEIIDISKIEAGLMEVRIKEVNIEDQLKYLHTFFNPEAERKGLDLTLKNTLLSGDAKFYTDGEKLSAVMINLIKNAIKYTEYGSIEFGCNLVQTGHALSQQKLLFFVKDTGIGIAAERQEAIFGRFIQADIEDINARQGAGLGLAISKAYIEMLGGEIWVDSEQGNGSCFTFSLPYIKTQQAGLQENTSTPEAGEQNKLANLNILIVDDEETASEYLKILLSNKCKNLFLAKNGAEALEIYKQNPGNIDITLLDLKMPIMSGYEAAKKILQINPDAKLIAQTAYGMSSDKVKCLREGFVDYIAKPIKKDELFKILTNHTIYP